MGFSSFDIGLQVSVEFDDDTGEPVLRNSECPWVFQQVSSPYKTFIPDNSSSLSWAFDGVINFQSYSDLGDYSFGTLDSDFLVNGVSFKNTFESHPYFEDATARSFSFRMPPKAILKGILANGGSYKNIPINLIVKGTYIDGGTTYSTEINAMLYLSLSKTSLTIESSSYYKAIFIGVIGSLPIGGVTYTDDTSFKTLPDFEPPRLLVLKSGPDQDNKNQLVAQLDIDESVKSFITESSVLPVFAVDSSSTDHFTLVTSVANDKINVLFNYPSSSTSSTINIYALKNFVEETGEYVQIATLSVGKGSLSEQNILLNSTVKAADFVETTDSTILFQKGGRVRCKEFIESSGNNIQLKKDYSMSANEFVEV